MPEGDDVLSWLHIGDLHITLATERNYRDLQRIVDLARGLPEGSVDFAVLPGDNADDGTPEQFRLPEAATARRHRCLLLDTQLGPNRNGRKW